MPMNHDRIAAGAAPGKVILFGEHAVVYGQPALAAALGHGLGASVEESSKGPTLDIPRWGTEGLSVEPNHLSRGDAMGRAFSVALKRSGLSPETPVKVTVDGQLPLGVGLGSSAAFAVALLRGLCQYAGNTLNDVEMAQAAEDIESIFHGNPSGLDHTVVLTGECLYFTRQSANTFQSVRLGRSLPLVISWTRREGTTREAVSQLAARRERSPAMYDDLFASMGRLAEHGRRALESGDLRQIGALFDLNHGYLNACGVSAEPNERMVIAARDAGAYGAKLTGAGHGGACIALAPDNPEAVVVALQRAGFDALYTEVA